MLLLLEYATETEKRYSGFNIDIGYNKRLDRGRPCFEEELTEWSNLQYKAINQFDAVLNDKL